MCGGGGALRCLPGHQRSTPLFPTQRDGPITRVLRNEVPEGPLRAAPHSMGEAAMEPLRPCAGPMGPPRPPGKQGHRDPGLRTRKCGSWGVLQMGASGLAFGVPPEAPAFTAGSSVRPPRCKRTAPAGGTAILAEGKFMAAVSGKARSHKSVSSTRPRPPREGRREVGQTSRSGRCGGISPSLIRIHHPSC